MRGLELKRWADPGTREGVWLLFGVAFILRLAVGLLLGRITAPEAFEAHDIANAILAGKGFVYPLHGVLQHSYYQPMYVWVSAAMYWIGGGSFVPLMLLQIAAGSATAALIGRVGARLFSAAAGLAAGLLVAIHPGFVVYASTRAHELPFDALAFALVFWGWLRLREEPSRANAAWLGLLLGLGMLERPTALVFLPIGAAWLWWRMSASQRPAIVRAAAIAAVIAAAVITPWTIRNVIVHDRLVFIRGSDWEMFWRGNNPNASGTSLTATGQPILATLPVQDRAELERLPDENEQARWFRARAFTFIREHPRAFLELTARKWFYFWWMSPQTGLEYAHSWRYGYQGFYAAVLLATVAGFVSMRRTARAAARDAAWLLGGMFLALSVLQSLYYVDGRHRWGIESLLLLLAGAGVAAVIPVKGGAIDAGRA